MSVYVRYFLMRFLMFATVALIAYMLGFRGWLLVLVAALVSMILAQVTLKSMRDRVTADVAARAGRRIKPRADHDAAAEDQLIDGQVVDVNTTEPKAAAKPGAAPKAD